MSAAFIGASTVLEKVTHLFCSLEHVPFFHLEPKAKLLFQILGNMKNQWGSIMLNILNILEIFNF